MNLGATLHDLFDSHAPVAPGLAPQPTGAANPVGVSLDPSVGAMMNQAPAPHHGSMLMGILADALAGAAGKEGPYAARMNQEHQMQMQEALWTNRQNSELDRQTRLAQYGYDHPNTEFDQAIRQAGIDPHSPQGQAMYAQRASTLAAPLQAFDYQGPDGTVTKQFFRPGAMSPVGGASPPPTAPVGHLTPVGGPTQPASGTFRR